MKLTKTNQRGDTIIEVLIAIAVISSVLAITYSIMNRNLLTMQDNQERTEASKIAQSQIEMLRNAWNVEHNALKKLPGKDDNLSAVPVCMKADSANPVVEITGGIPNEYTHDDFSTYSVCRQGIYNMAIRSNGSDNYLISVRWDSLTGTKSEVVMGYKLK